MENIRQELHFPVSASVFYTTLLDEKSHAAFTGAAAKIDPQPAGSFEAYDGYIHGRNLELIPGKLIRQSWQAHEEVWPPDHFSTITLRIQEDKNGCRVEFTHEEIPEGQAERYAAGWKEHYWDKLSEYFSQ